jgi:hypothetical protein
LFTYPASRERFFLFPVTAGFSTTFPDWCCPVSCTAAPSPPSRANPLSVFSFSEELDYRRATFANSADRSLWCGARGKESFESFNADSPARALPSESDI